MKLVEKLRIIALVILVGGFTAACSEQDDLIEPSIQEDQQSAGAPQYGLDRYIGN